MQQTFTLKFMSHQQVNLNVLAATVLSFLEAGGIVGRRNVYMCSIQLITYVHESSKLKDSGWGRVAGYFCKRPTL